MKVFTAKILFAFLLWTSVGRVAFSAETGEPKLNELPVLHGLVVQVGANPNTTMQICKSNVLLHVLDRDRNSIRDLQDRLQEVEANASVTAESWTKSTLPHAENLANFVVLENSKLIKESEVNRVLAPNGVAFIRQGDTYVRMTKSAMGSTDEWTHQWHGTDGGLTTEDQQIGVPQGVQWISGPLFAMAGRKSSTQTLVSSGGLNFYITQNVLDNVGLAAEEMQQYLVARDAYNGLKRWQRKWTGPFVTGNGETNPRMVASNGKLYATDHDGLLQLDPETGKTMSEIKLKTKLDKIVVTGERVLIQSESKVRVFDLMLEQELWSFEGKKLSGLVISAGHCFLLSSGRSADGRFQHDLISINLESGDIAWRTNTQPHEEAARVRINFVADGFVALQAHGSLHMFSAEDGQHLWSKETDARPGKTYVDERYVGHFYRRGLVWMLTENSPRESLGQNVWLGLNPSTGKVSRTLKTTGNWPRTDTPAKMGCQVLVASDRYIMIPRQATFIDFETGEKLPFKFTRGGCGLGFVPANGLVYSHPHACGCYSEALRGFMGMHSHSSESLRKSDETDDRLTKYLSPAVAVKGVSSSNDWPMYRGNGERGAYAPASIGRDISAKWSTIVAKSGDSASSESWDLRTGNAITPPTIANGIAFVAEVDAGRLHALDVTSGQGMWSFAAAGRIDSPPTLYGGLCLFGAHDGYVYCLDSRSGKLVWRFRAAPTDRRIVAFGAVESTWPVAGSVLIQDGVAFVAAGRAPDADGGIEVHALRPTSGEVIWSKRIDGGTFRGLADYLIGGKKLIYLGNQRIDPKTGDVAEVASDSPHLRGGKVGLLESSWTKHDLALRKGIQTWTAQGTAGQLLCFSDEIAVAYDFEAKQVQVHGDENEHIPVPAPRQVTGMAITNESLVLAGGLDRSDSTQGGFLQIVDLVSGDMVAEHDLTAEAVFDGIALAEQRIFVSTQDGKLHCFTSR